MNSSTLWTTTTTEEVFGHFFLGIVSFFVHTYAIIICFAIIDYQEEKPVEEKGPFDLLIQDLIYCQMRLLFYAGFIYHISIFSTSITNKTVLYGLTYLGVFSLNFWCVSCFVTLSIGYMFVFQPDFATEIQILTVRLKISILKVLLTLLSLLLSFLFQSPLKSLPPQFDLLSKGELKYERYVRSNTVWKFFLST